MVTKLQSFEFCVNLQENTLWGSSFLVIDQLSILVVMSLSFVYEFGGREISSSYWTRERESPKAEFFVRCNKQEGRRLICRGAVYLDMPSECLMPQLQEDSVDCVWVQDGAPHCFHIVSWRESPTVLVWPCSSHQPLDVAMTSTYPDLTSYDCFVTTVFERHHICTSKSSILLQLRERIVAALGIDLPTL